MVGKWEDINNAKDREPDTWSPEEKDFSGFNPASAGVPRRASPESRQEDKPFRNPGTNSQGTNTLISGRGRPDKRTVLELLKKLTRRLELLEQKYKKYVGDHRSRLIARLNDNEEFALDVDSEVNQLKFDIEEVERVLGASETIIE